jgi:hypothetical protein
MFLPLLEGPCILDVRRHMGERARKGGFTHTMPFSCRSPALSAKGLDCVFPVRFTQCGRVWFTHVMPFPCHATNMPFWKRPLRATAGEGHGNGMVCELASAVQRRHMGDLPAFGFFRLPLPSRKVIIRSVPISDAGGQCETSNVCHGRGEAYYFGARTWVLV